MNDTGVPDAIEPIRAWRVWRGSAEADGSLVLCSLTPAGGGTRWPPGEALEASCPTAGHTAPNSTCSCGIYAHKTREAAINHVRGASGVVGEVELWGRVVEHEHGYRAQWARPRALWLPLALNPYTPNADHVTAALSQRAALRRYGGAIGLYHPDTGHTLDLADIRRVFTPEPAPQTPLRELLPRIAWSCLRVALIMSTSLVAGLVTMVAFAAVTILGLLLPLQAGAAVATLLRPGWPSIALGTLTGLTIVAVYIGGAHKFNLFEKANNV